MDLDAYLERVGYHGDRAPTLENLRAMHRAHAYTVPFENLDIARGTRIVVDETVNLDKIVTRRRGGFCLELTGLFGRSLRQMGYEVDVIGARVMSDGRLSHPFSHMTLIVHLDERWIADVGFGGRIIAPLRVDERGQQAADGRTYVVANDEDHWFVTSREPMHGAGTHGSPDATYTFRMQRREFDEFHVVCDWLQTSPDSRFTSGDVVSLATPRGRHTFIGGRLITTDGNDREEREVPPADQPAVLADVFGIALP